MKWTKEKPTVPGWYWWRFKSGFTPDMVYVTMESVFRPVEKDRLVILFPHSDVIRFVDERGGEWSGPIPEPKE